MSETFRLQLDHLRHSLVPDIIPLDYYNHKKSRLRCSIAWLLSKIFDGRVPLEYEDPLIDDENIDDDAASIQQQQQQLELNPSVAALLTSGKAYADAARLILRQANISFSTSQSLHSLVLVLLNQHGFYQLSNDPSSKNSLHRLEAQLSLNSPFRASIHQSVMDALMKAYIVNNLSTEKIVGALRLLGPLALGEQPHTSEQALLLWIGKVCGIARSEIELNKKKEIAAKLRQRGKNTVRLDNTDDITIPVVNDLLADISDGAALATLITHYCPDHLGIGDVALKENLGVADSCFNLELVHLFSDHLDHRVYFFRLEDLLYMHSSFKPNVLVFLADLFLCLTAPPPLLCSCTSNENSTGRRSLLNDVEFSSDFGDEEKHEGHSFPKSTVVVVADDDRSTPTGNNYILVPASSNASNGNKHQRLYAIKDAFSVSTTHRPYHRRIRLIDDDSYWPFHGSHAEKHYRHYVRHLNREAASRRYYASRPGRHYFDSGSEYELPRSSQPLVRSWRMPAAFSMQRLSADTSSSDHFIPSLSNLSPRQSGHSTGSGHSTARPITSSYRVSDSRQHKTLADAMDAGLPIVDLNSSISSRSSSQHTTPNRITWAQLQQQRRAAADETDDSEVEKPVTRLSGSNGLGNRSQSVGSLSLKLMMMERQRREAESASRALKSNRRVSDHYGTTSRVWPTKGSDNEFNHHLVQLKQSLSDLQSQVPNLTPRKKQHHQEHTVPTPVRVMAQPPAQQQFQQPPMMMYPQPGQVMQPTYYGQQQHMIDPRYAAFQSTQSLIMPNQAHTLPYGSPSMQTISAFNTFSTPTHHHLTNGMSTQSTIAMSPTQNGGNYFMPITSSGGSGENDSVSMTSTRKMLQDEDDISSQGINDVRRSQSMSAIQNRMRNSSSSLANHQQHNDDDDDLSEDHKDKQENVAFVVGVGEKGDADELEMKRKQKVFEMIMKRKKETSGKKDNRTLEEAKQRQAILEEQQEKERRRQEHRERQQRKFEEYQQRKKEEEEQLELAKSGRSKTMGSTMTLPKSKSRDQIGQTNGTLGRTKNNQLVKVGEEETPPTTPRGGSATLRTTSRRNGPSSAPAPHSEVTGAELVPATTARPAWGTIDVLKQQLMLEKRLKEENEAASASKQLPTGRSRSTIRQAKSLTSLRSSSVTPSVPLRVQPSAKSNRTIIYNAIRDTCLAGGANSKQREAALEALDKAPNTVRHFIILFRDAGCQYRGLYTFEQDAQVIERIHGIGPKSVRNKMIENFFKYNSGSKRFSKIPTTQHLSVSVDAVSMYQNYWQARHAPNSAPLNSTMSRSATLGSVSSIASHHHQQTPVKTGAGLNSKRNANEQENESVDINQTTTTNNDD